MSLYILSFLDGFPKVDSKAGLKPETEIFGLLLKGRYDSHYLYYIIVDDPNRTLTDKSA